MLNDLKIKQLKPKDKLYRIADHSGLCIEVRTSGRKFWRYRYRYLNTPKMLTIGSYPEISLSYARDKTREYRSFLAQNLDPVTEQKKALDSALEAIQHTFKSISNEYLEKYKDTHSQEWYKNRLRYYKLDIYPVIGNKPIKEVNSNDIRVILDNTITRIRESKRGTGEVKAIYVRQICAEVMQYAIITLKIVNDPTIALRNYIKRPPVEHATPLEGKDKKVILALINQYGGTTSTKNTLKTALYSMLRTIEIRRTKKSFVNLEDATLTIPHVSKAQIKDGKRNMKKNRTHVVPLSTQMLEIIKEQLKLYPNSIYLFPGDDGISMMGKNTPSQALVNMGLGHISPHDFRATASTYLNEQNYSKDWIELQLAHVDGDMSRASYNHASWLKDRREMMQHLADTIDQWHT